MYDKIRAYRDRLPVHVYDKWQPPQLLKILLQIEPRADRDYSMRICREDGSGNPSGEWHHLGTHNALKFPWLQKTYNKLGNYLHVPSPRAQEQSPPNPLPEKVRAELLGIIRDLEPVVASTIEGTLAVTIVFDCSECEKPVICNLEGLKNTHTATCLNPSCGAQYSALESPNDEFEFILVTTRFKCIQCEQENLIQTRHIGIGFTFPCSSCGAVHRVEQWAYGLVDATSSAG
jgi:transcription elongation factor Elf1